MIHRRRALALAAAVAGCTVLAACTSAGHPAAHSTPVPSTRTVVAGTSTPPAATFTPAPATTVPALRGRTTAPEGERFARCPYIRSGLNQDTSSVGANIADLEGDRVGRSTVLTGYRPVGCRFYFAYSYGDTRHEAVADILPTTLTSAAAAHNALVLTARAGRNQQSAPNFVPGVDGIQYQTTFFGPDGPRDWAFAFAKGRVLVVIHTQQNDSPLNALQIGKAIVAKF